MKNKKEPLLCDVCLCLQISHRRRNGGGGGGGQGGQAPPII